MTQNLNLLVLMMHSTNGCCYILSYLSYHGRTRFSKVRIGIDTGLKLATTQPLMLENYLINLKLEDFSSFLTLTENFLTRI